MTTPRGSDTIVLCAREAPEVVQLGNFTLRLPEEVHEKLRWLAYKQRRSQHSIVVEAVRKALQEVKVPKEAKT